MADNKRNSGQPQIPVELLLSHIGQQVQVNLQAHRQKLLADLEAKRLRLRELQERKLELASRTAAPPATVFQPADAYRPEEAEEIGSSPGSDDLFGLGADLWTEPGRTPAQAEASGVKPALAAAPTGDDGWMFGADDDLAGEALEDKKIGGSPPPLPDAPVDAAAGAALPAVADADGWKLWADDDLLAEEPTPSLASSLPPVTPPAQKSPVSVPASPPARKSPAAPSKIPAATDFNLDLEDILGELSAIDPDLATGAKL